MSDNNGLPGEIGVPLDTPDGHKLKADAGLSYLPTQLTYECRLAISGEGPLAYTWEDKPHRLVYTLCREIERLAALTPAEADAEIEKLRAALIEINELNSKRLGYSKKIERVIWEALGEKE